MTSHCLEGLRRRPGSIDDQEEMVAEAERLEQEAVSSSLEGKPEAKPSDFASNDEAENHRSLPAGLRDPLDRNR